MNDTQQFINRHHKDLLNRIPYHKNKVDLKALENILNKQQSSFQNKNTERFVSEFNKRPSINANAIDLSKDIISIYSASNINPEKLNCLKNVCHTFDPWRKGPFDLFGVKIDAEWQSNLKWDRISNHLPPLEDKRIVDIGCNNGYYLFRMNAHKPNYTLGVDPSDLYFMQFQLLQSYIKAPNIDFAPIRLEDLSPFKMYFDVVFCLGVLYHRKSPIDSLKQIKNIMKPRGTFILETLTIDGETDTALFPKDTYCMMRNVYFVPTISCLKNWILRAGFSTMEIISSNRTTTHEQRATDWTFEQSLSDFLDEKDHNKTKEGYPSPIRTLVKIR